METTTNPLNGYRVYDCKGNTRRIDLNDKRMHCGASLMVRHCHSNQCCIPLGVPSLFVHHVKCSWCSQYIIVDINWYPDMHVITNIRLEATNKSLDWSSQFHNGFGPVSCVSIILCKSRYPGGVLETQHKSALTGPAQNLLNSMMSFMMVSMMVSITAQKTFVFTSPQWCMTSTSHLCGDPQSESIC